MATNEPPRREPGIMIVCFIHCLDCMGPIDDYDPALDQYTCKNCREKAANRTRRRNKRQKPLAYDEAL